ncbi:MAG: hypothetical protein EG823_08115 [Actinobacteria bacterium]|nr:hypothetical protein [Actinomycetota bacterium]
MGAPYHRLGRIVRTHGLEGEVYVASCGDLASSVEKDVWVVPPSADGAVARRMTDVRPTPRGTLLKIAGVETVAGAHELVGRWLLARGEGPPWETTGDSPIGVRVRDAERGEIGSITDVIVTGANDVYVVEGGPFGQVLVPVIEEVVIGMTKDGTTLEVRLLPGLIDEGTS